MLEMKMETRQTSAMAQTTRIHELAALGQSIWFDYIERSLVADGGLERLVAQGVTGVTSNPSIFEKAIASSTRYDADIRALAEKDAAVTEIYEALALEDIGRAADILRPVYDQTQGRDGFVSLEVSPDLAYDEDGTVAEGVRLFSTLARPNVMIKVPATCPGMDAISRLTALGVNVNVTLIFSLGHYAAAARAYIGGLQKLAQTGPGLSCGLPFNRVASVASVFVSRTDSALDPVFEIKHRDDLIGQASVALMKCVYARFSTLFFGAEWEALARQGARVQRPLWASTSAKNPDFPDTYYVDSLIGPHTVNTVPPSTLEAFLDHGTVAKTLTRNVDEAQGVLRQVADMGIGMNQVMNKLQEDGIQAFSRSFATMLGSIKGKRDAILARRVKS